MHALMKESDRLERAVEYPIYYSDLSAFLQISSGKNTHSRLQKSRPHKKGKGLVTFLSFADTAVITIASTMKM